MNGLDDYINGEIMLSFQWLQQIEQKYDQQQMIVRSMILHFS
jgi:hypothetical protein